MRKTSHYVFALCAMLFALCVIAEAQQPKVYRVGVLLPGDAWYEIINGLRFGLRQLGFEEGKQIVLEIRDTKADLKVAEEAARNLEQERVNLIFTTRTSVTIAAKRATADIPIVFSAGSDPVVLGLVESFAKPGGRLTGVYEPGTDLTAKRLEILKEIVPKLSPDLGILRPAKSCRQRVRQVSTGGGCAAARGQAGRTALRFGRGTSGGYTSGEGGGGGCLLPIVGLNGQ